MKRASVSEAKNGLSGLLSEVRRGEAVLITHPGRTVARIDPCHVAGPDAEHAIADLLSRGVAVPPRAPLDVDRFLRVPIARLTEGAKASEIIVKCASAPLPWPTTDLPRAFSCLSSDDYHPLQATSIRSLPYDVSGSMPHRFRLHGGPPHDYPHEPDHLRSDRYHHRRNLIALPLRGPTVHPDLWEPNTTPPNHTL